MGDPAGVGPELCVRLLLDEALHREVTPLVFGDSEVLRAVAAKIGLEFYCQCLSIDRWLSEQNGNKPTVIDVAAIRLDQFAPGRINAATGRAGFTYVDRAIDAVLSGKVDAVATAPLSKEAMFMAGLKFPGHTEIFASRAGSSRWCMMQYSAEITCTFVTVHVGYAEVPQLLTTERIFEVIELTHENLLKLDGKSPRIVVCGLNPHAGEHGLFGDREEERLIIPAIDLARAKGISVEGPLPADTAFIPAKRKTTEAFVCMYHDQGHIPVKALAFDSAVNTTLGLPIIRTSVDHGTALDIAWKGEASPSSLLAAIRLAVRWIE